MPLALLLGLSAILSNCTKGGPNVDVCIVDAENSQFTCVSSDGKEYDILFANGLDLKCVSTDDAEHWLKVCKNGAIASVTLCQYDPSKFMFFCEYPQGGNTHMIPESVNNYVCLSSRDRSRVEERCGK